MSRPRFTSVPSAGHTHVEGTEKVVRFAGLLADRSRAAMCLALIDGRAWTATELADHAGIGLSTASEHLSQLVAAGLLVQEHQGRHRYLKLAGPEIATLIEDVVTIVGVPLQPNSLRSVRAAGQLAAARTCYDHVAGALGVGIFDAMVATGLISTSDGLHLTAAGRDWFVEFAGEDSLRTKTSRPMLRTCLDWTERRTHLGGLLGAVVLTELLTRKWVVPGRQHRGLTLTADGVTGLDGLLGI